MPVACYGHEYFDDSDIVLPLKTWIIYYNKILKNTEKGAPL